MDFLPSPCFNIIYPTFCCIWKPYFEVYYLLFCFFWKSHITYLNMRVFHMWQLFRCVLFFVLWLWWISKLLFEAASIKSWLKLIRNNNRSEYCPQSVSESQSRLLFDTGQKLLSHVNFEQHFLTWKIVIWIYSCKKQIIQRKPPQKMERQCLLPHLQEFIVPL